MAPARSRKLCIADDDSSSSSEEEVDDDIQQAGSKKRRKATLAVTVDPEVTEAVVNKVGDGLRDKSKKCYASQMKHFGAWCLLVERNPRDIVNSSTMYLLHVLTIFVRIKDLRSQPTRTPAQQQELQELEEGPGSPHLRISALKQLHAGLQKAYQKALLPQDVDLLQVAVYTKTYQDLHQQEEQQLGSTALHLASGAPGLQQHQEEQQLGSTARPLACGAPGLHQQEEQQLGSTALPLACGAPGLHQQQEQHLGSTALPLASGAPGLQQQEHQQEQHLGSTALPLASGAPGLQQQEHQQEQQLGSTALPLASGAPGLQQQEHQQEQQLGSTALHLASGAPGLQQQEHQQEQQLGSTALHLASGAPAEQLQQQAPVTEAMKLYRKGRYGQPPLCELEKDPSWRKGRKDLARRVCEIKKLIRLSDWYLETQCSVAKSKQEALDQLCHATRGIGAWSSQLKWLEALQGQLQPPTYPTSLAAAGRLTGQLQAPTSPTPLAAAGRLTGLLQPPYSPTPLAAAGRLTGQLQAPTSLLPHTQQPPYSPTPLAAAGSGAGLLQPPTSPTPLAAAGRLTGLLQPPYSPTPLAAAGRLTGQLQAPTSLLPHTQQPPYSPTPLAAAGSGAGLLQPPTYPTSLAAAGRLTGLLLPPYSPTPLAAAGSGAGQLQPPTSPTPLAAAGRLTGLQQPPTSPTPLAAAGRLTGQLQAPTSLLPHTQQPPYSPTPLAAAGSGAGLLQPPTSPTPLAAAGRLTGLLLPPYSPTPLAAAGSGAGLLQPPTYPTSLAAAGRLTGLLLPGLVWSEPPFYPPTERYREDMLQRFPGIGSVVYQHLDSDSRRAMRLVCKQLRAAIDDAVSGIVIASIGSDDHDKVMSSTMPQLRSLDVSCHVDVSVCRAWQRLPHLSSLTLTLTRASRAAAASLPFMGLEHITSLRSLDLSHSGGMVDEGSLAACTQLTKLINVRWFPGLTQLTQLQQLGVVQGLSSDSLPLLATLPQLADLKLAYCPLQPSSQQSRFLFQHLTSLTVDSIHSRDLAALDCRQLQTLTSSQLQVDCAANLRACATGILQHCNAVSGLVTYNHGHEFKCAAPGAGVRQLGLPPSASVLLEALAPWQPRSGKAIEKLGLWHLPDVTHQALEWLPVNIRSLHLGSCRLLPGALSSVATRLTQLTCLDLTTSPVALAELQLLAARAQQGASLIVFTPAKMSKEDVAALNSFVSYMKSGTGHLPFANCTFAAEHDSDLGAHELAVLVEGLSRCQLQGVDPRLFAALGHAAVPHVLAGAFSPGGLASLLAGFARARQRHAPLGNAAARVAALQAEAFTCTQLANLLWALSVMRV
ncbi:hypothetical protein QJQ45_022812, partial [Haematococcus lacustris]